MRTIIRAVVAMTVLSLSIALGAAEKHPHATPHEHGHASKHANFGRPGKADQVQRTIEVKALDTLRYDPQTFTVKAGETVRFVVTNVGQLKHEFIIGDPAEQRAHAEMMKKMPGMVHEDPNALSLEPGETKALIWQFGQAGVVEVACHVPGHYEAGMVAQVKVEELK
jgi:uncharacterized cupredoxin-like copper-binding protein